MHGGSDEESGTAFGFLRIPESFEIFADRFDANGPRRRDSRGPTHRSDQIDVVTSLRERLLKEQISVQPSAGTLVASDEAGEQNVHAVGLVEDTAAHCECHLRWTLSEQRHEHFALL